MAKRKAPAAEPEDKQGDLQVPSKLQKGADGTPVFRNKEKVLLLSSRGITHR